VEVLPHSTSNSFYAKCLIEIIRDGKVCLKQEKRRKEKKRKEKRRQPNEFQTDFKCKMAAVLACNYSDSLQESDVDLIRKSERILEI
jgi:hypothetical protein